MTGRHVQEGHRYVGGAEGFLGEAEQADGILSTREEDGGPLKLRGDLAHDVDRLGLEVVQMV